MVSKNDVEVVQNSLKRHLTRLGDPEPPKSSRVSSNIQRNINTYVRASEGASGREDVDKDAEHQSPNASQASQPEERS